MKLEEARKLVYDQSVFTDTGEVLKIRQEAELTKICPTYMDLEGNVFIYVSTERGVWPSNRLTWMGV